MVRLLRAHGAKQAAAILSFNPTMVRLLLVPANCPVRFEGFQSHNGAIAAQ